MEGLLASGAADTYLPSFQPLEIHRKGLKTSGYYYHVYKDLDDFVEVEAPSAYEAMRQSNVEKPYKIVRRAVKEQSSVPREMLVDVAESAPESVQPAAPAEEISGEAAEEAQTAQESSSEAAEEAQS